MKEGRAVRRVGTTPWKERPHPGPWASALLVLLSAAVAFAPALRNEFLDWDDAAALLQQKEWRGLGWKQLEWMWTTFSIGQYRPVTWMSYAFDYLLWGLQPHGFHLTSIVFHVANGLLLLLLLRSLWPKRPALTLFATLFYTLHPLRVEAVAWVSARADVLATFFGLLCVLAWLRVEDGKGNPRRRALWCLAAAALFGLSVAAKPVALALPFVLLLLSAWRRKWTSPSRQELLSPLPLLVLAMVAGGLAIHAKAATGPFSDQGDGPAGIGLAAYSIALLLGKTVIPFGLTYSERPIDLAPYTLQFIGCGLFVAAVTALLVVRRRAAPGWLACWAAFLGLLAPVAGVVRFGAQLAADRFSYLPSIALSVGIVGGLDALARRARMDRPRLALAAGTLAMALLFGLGIATSQQCQVWRSSATYWTWCSAGTRIHSWPTTT